ncbi:hypothetical protein AUDREY_38 [Mycobacterium phage Audrey]|uniref:DUF7172 domain-containing protein n=1 Tax=Mycobacterium phage Audrey TaxID=1458709 RepID=X2KSD7_9CAUD|nr:hypothetical protein AUDREY_38 [Mycobacterium phage Audrey]
MTAPSPAHPDHFEVLGDAIRPQPWMQLRPVGSGASAPSASRVYDPSGGVAKNEVLQTMQDHWTNNSPIPQYVYGLVTRGGSQVTLQARSRGYIEQSHGILIAPVAEDDDFEMAVVSKFGVGADIGKGGTLALGTSFGVAELRENSATIQLMPHITGWQVVQPGETFHARVETRFRSEYWESTSIDGGDTNAVSQVISGEQRLDLFACPAVTPPPPRPTPEIVGSPTYGIAVGDLLGEVFGSGAVTRANVPEGTEEGDTILAIVANNFGLASDIVPVEEGWTKLGGTVNDGLGGIADVHAKMYVRQATDDEPDDYGFGNGILAEETVVLVTIRNAEPDIGQGWNTASALRRFFWERDDGHIAPSIDRKGQLLLCASYLGFSVTQPYITQEAPDHMTEILDVHGNGSSFALAAMENPPRPTGARTFAPSADPVWSGRSITLTILIPGKLEL